MSKMLDDFRRQGYSSRALPIPESVFADVAASFLDVLARPQEELASLHLYRTKKRKETPLGYTRKNEGYNEKGEWRDGKSYFHYSRNGELKAAPHIIEYAARYEDFRVFLEQIADLTRRFEPVAFAILTELETAYPELPQTFIRGGRIENLQVRINAYDEKAGGEVSAIEHFDVSGITLSGWESASGLFFKHNGKVAEAVRIPGQTFIMPGYIFSKMTGHTIKPLLHFVQQPKNTRVVGGVGRMSIVCFVDQLLRPETIIPNWKESHPTHSAGVA